MHGISNKPQEKRTDLHIENKTTTNSPTSNGPVLQNGISVGDYDEVLKKQRKSAEDGPFWPRSAYNVAVCT